MHKECSEGHTDGERDISATRPSGHPYALVGVVSALRSANSIEE